ncbi:hypothetical protein [Actinoplanes sp. NPDC026670]|uniref:hypothetical protein n=1 Tax=Actinoplanes sp. NPDC026670 TaxID=3154700 RepID=UPI0033D5ACBF
MSANGYVISTGPDGRLVGMTPDGLGAVMLAAAASPRMVLHVHGGLVDENAGLRIAESLTPVYRGAGAYPVFVVWRAGLGEIVRNNLVEIAREEIFERLTSRVLSWSVGWLRGRAEGSRSSGASRPTEPELAEHLAARRRFDDPDQGEEPFADEEPFPGEQITAAEQSAFLTELETDPYLTQWVTTVAPRAEAGARGGIDPGTGVPTRMDTEVLAEITPDDPDGARGGGVVTVYLARKALQVLRAVIGRFRDRTDSGLYPTVVEEMLRVFYLGAVGAVLWSTMKKETEDAFRPGDDRAGTLLLSHLAAAHDAGTLGRVTLVGHSTGAVYLDNLLLAADRGRFQVCYLAPACTTEHFARTLDAATDRIGRFRMFTMTDEAERADRLAGAVYPRSLLYLVSGLLERDRGASAVVPVLGLARYLTPGGSAAFRLDSVHPYTAGPDRLILSPTGAQALAGARSTAVRHGDFDDDALVRDSLAHLVRSW